MTSSQHDTPESDTPMTGTYVAVLILEAVIIAALWALGRIYS
ncbi:MAG: hypothetical protein ABMA15_27175 [Vicinamibacterales bacterium]